MTLPQQTIKNYQELKHIIRSVENDFQLIPGVDVLQDNKSLLQLLGVFGTDMTPVNTARQSYNKESLTFKEAEARLLSFLLKHKHSSPFRACVIRLKVVLPLFLAEQWKKHQIAFSNVDDQNGSNQRSMRYTEATEFYVPKIYRKTHLTDKQSSQGQLDDTYQLYADDIYEDTCKDAIQSYQDLLKLGVCKEQARGVLPEATYTSLICTISLPAALHFILLRKDSHAQWEIQQYAIILEEMLQVFFPNILAAALNNNE